jgi:hypothetical protein
MPSSIIRHLAGVIPPRALTVMSGSEAARPDLQLITPWSWESIGAELLGGYSGGGQIISATYPSANLAIAVPFQTARALQIRKMFWANGTTAGTNSVDVGVYSLNGARLVSGGGTLSVGANTLQEVDVTDTMLQPGSYYMAYAQNGVTMTPIMQSLAQSANMRCCGIAQMASAYVLPTTFTFAASTTSVLVPFFGLSTRVLVA